MDTLVALVFNGLMLGSIYTCASLGLTLTFGVVKVVNFAHGEFIMLAMYGAYVLEGRGWDVYATGLVVVPALFLCGVLLQRFVIQPLIDSEELQVFATFGLLILLQASALTITKGDFLTVDTELGRSRVTLLGVSTNWPKLFFIPAAVALTWGLHLLLYKTWIGRAMRAVSADRPAARLMGIHVERIYLLTSALGAAIAGITGVLAAPLYVVTPDVGGQFIFAAFAVVVLGGLGSVPGALVGGLVIGLTETLTGYFLDPSLKQEIWFALFIAVLVVRPYGIFTGQQRRGISPQPMGAEA